MLKDQSGKKSGKFMGNNYLGAKDYEGLRKKLAASESAWLPPVSDGEWKEYDFNPDPLASLPFLELAGRMPHKKSADISESILGIGFETLDRRTFEPTKIFPFLAESGV
ncbi:MAG: hypothetical protein PHV82_16125, partial [Victivallaceae bacterium]|nr:hypothetical protein [Victivallaceae bacterium]